MPKVNVAPPGVFHRRHAPDREPFVEVGAKGREGQIIALIEVMKTFSEVKAEHSGPLGRFLLDEGDEVQTGQGIAELEAMTDPNRVLVADPRRDRGTHHPRLPHGRDRSGGGVLRCRRELPPGAAGRARGAPRRLPPAAKSYLDGTAAQHTRPRYGFPSENPRFARAAQDAE